MAAVLALPVFGTVNAAKTQKCCGCCVSGKCDCATCACCDCSQCPACSKK